THHHAHLGLFIAGPPNLDVDGSLVTILSEVCFLVVSEDHEMSRSTNPATPWRECMVTRARGVQLTHQRPLHLVLVARVRAALRREMIPDVGEVRLHRILLDVKGLRLERREARVLLCRKP